MSAVALSPEAGYVLLLFGLFVVPRVLQRLRIPAAITSLALGALAGPGLGLFQEDPTIKLLSTLGIVSLFLFAGLDVDLRALRKETRILGEHLAVRLLALGAVAAAAATALGMGTRPAVLVALALLTPSTGFILDSLPGLGLAQDAVFWIRAKAIATEIVALVAMFVTLQSATPMGFALSATVLVTMIALLPLLFHAFARFVLPHAPKTEFAFLLMVAVVCALVTRKLGVYYLVGAFVVGIVAQRFREKLPAMASEKMLHAVEAFASIFVPFYFFGAGLLLKRSDMSWTALLYGAGFLATAVPLRLALVALHRRIRFRERARESLRVGIPMLPTLVFTLVIAQVLRDRFEVSSDVFAGLILYALVNTVIPSLFFRSQTPEFETPEAPLLTEDEEERLLRDGPATGPAGRARGAKEEEQCDRS
ncbi:MAG: cation:proton antiporter [Deltaproteobacteria bacterium]|nr:cation:proton antiporter [Deltaproteobacteria bacterium]